MESNQASQREAMIQRWDDVFDALAAEPRRQIIVSLLEAPDCRDLSLPEAANPPYLLRDPSELTVELVHTHLPKLADNDYVEWQRDPLTVMRGRNFEEAAVVFEALYEDVDRIPSQLVDGCQRLEEKRRDD